MSDSVDLTTDAKKTFADLTLDSGNPNQEDQFPKLPDEIMVMLFRWIANEEDYGCEWFALPQVCKRFHAIAISTLDVQGAFDMLIHDDKCKDEVILKCLIRHPGVNCSSFPYLISTLSYDNSFAFKLLLENVWYPDQDFEECVMLAIDTYVPYRIADTIEHEIVYKSTEIYVSMLLSQPRNFDAAFFLKVTEHAIICNAVRILEILLYDARIFSYMDVVGQIIHQIDDGNIRFPSLSKIKATFSRRKQLEQDRINAKEERESMLNGDVWHVVDSAMETLRNNRRRKLI